MKHLAFTAAEFRKNVVRTNGMPLRGTKTSEISSFVKNCNVAEATQLQKELSIWHKDTNFTVRKLGRKSEVMYKSLLQISTAKKKIKNVRQSKVTDKEKEKTWKSSNRQSRRRANVFARDLELNLTEISEKDETSTEREADLMSDMFKRERKNNNLNSKSVSKNIDSNIHEILSIGDSTVDSIEKRTIEDYSIDFSNNKKCQGEAKRSNMKKRSLNEISSPRERPYKKKTHSNVSIKNVVENNSQQHLNAPLEGANYVFDSSHQNVSLKSVSPSSISNQPNDQSEKQNSRTIKNNDAEKQSDVDEQLIEYAIDDVVLQNLPDTSGKVNINFLFENNQKLDLSKPLNHFNGGNIYKKKSLRAIKPKKHKVDPSVELNMNSSIKARPGKVHEVAVYKKSTNGTLEKEVLSLDTTIDVYKHFKIASHKERLQRKQLLIEARNIEAMQRHRVNNFIRKLDREDELKSKAETNRKKRSEEEMEFFRRQLEARSRSPPKYGPGGHNSAPNYVRTYIKPLQSGSSRQNRACVRKRSSWSIPSLYTLQLNETSGAQLYLNPNSSAGGIPFHSSGFMAQSGASHLVNINTARYQTGAEGTSGS